MRLAVLGLRVLRLRATFVTASAAGIIAATVLALLATAAITTLLAVAVAVIALALVLLAGLLGKRGAGRFGGVASKQALEPTHHATTGDRGGGCRLRERRCGCRLCHFFAFFAQRCRLCMFDVGDGGRDRDVELGLGQRMHRQLARGVALVAGLGAFFAELVLTHARHFVMRRVQGFVGNDDDRRVVARFDFAQRAALFVEQEVGDLHRRLYQHLSGVFLHRMLFSHADYGQRQRFDAAHAAVAFALRAHDLAGFTQAGAQALAAHFHQAEAGDAADLHACAVVLQRVLQAVFHVTLVLAAGHVDEVDDHQAAQVAQAQLAGHFIGGFHVGLERGVLDVAALGGARGVDVDRGQRFGLVDHDGAARG